MNRKNNDVKQVWDNVYIEKEERSKCIWSRLNRILIKKIQKEVVSKALILEAGCGISVLMNSFPSATVVGIDISLIALKKARKIYKKPIFIQGDIRYLPFRKESFDIVYNIGVIEHFVKPKSALIEMFRVSKFSGRVIVAVPNKYNLWTFGRKFVDFVSKFNFSQPWKYGYEKAYSTNELRYLFESSGFEVKKIFNVGTFEAIYITAYFSLREFNLILKLLHPLLLNETKPLWGKILFHFTKIIEKIEKFGLLVIAFSSNEKHI
jgi:ubiquinone/menaquinone biosynthesis C-methylase UbiE